jgi:hypothetical protein
MPSLPDDHDEGDRYCASEPFQEIGIQACIIEALTEIASGCQDGAFLVT